MVLTTIEELNIPKYAQTKQGNLFKLTHRVLFRPKNEVSYKGFFMNTKTKMVFRCTVTDTTYHNMVREMGEIKEINFFDDIQH